jgi:hypothetical protein
MSTPNQLPNPETPVLGDILQLQATIESLPEDGLRDTSESERLAVHRTPDGIEHSEGTIIRIFPAVSAAWVPLREGV